MRAGETPNTPLRLLAALLLFVFCGSALAGTATLTWDPVANPTVAGYMLHYGPAAGNYTAAVDAGKSTTRAVASLTEGATYHFVVTAYDASRTESSYSNDVAVTIPYAVPSASFSVSAVTGAAPLALNFNNTSSGTITSYAWAFGDGTTASVRSPSHVYSSPGLYSVSLTVSGPGGSNTKTIANLVTVIAPVDGSPPGAPSALVATAAGSSLVNLAWGAATDNVGVAGYRIERCAGAACTGFAQIATTSARTFADSGVVAATNYSYRVRATDAAGNAGAYSNVATATTATPSPTATSTTLKSTTNPSLAGASIVLTATVSGSAPSGTVQFTQNGTTIAGCGGVVLAAATRSATCASNALPIGHHAIVARYTGDAINAASSSASLDQVVAVAPGGSINVALAVNGGVASASSTLRPANDVKYVNDNKRSGAGWSTGGGGWADASPAQFPDWVQVVFAGARTIDHVVVYSVQDDYQHPAEPTATMSFTRYGITAFTVQGWNGAAWVTLGSVSGNTLVKRTVTFTPYTTDRIRVLVNGVADAAWSRITEIEAWTASSAATPANYALDANGGVATASSTLRAINAVNYVNDGQRSGAGWSTGGGGWADATSGKFPDWVQVAFSGSKTIDHVVVYSVQDGFQNPVAPTDSMTFSRYGVTAFEVQAWDGVAWVTLASVTGNNLVKRTVAFAPFTTDRIRVMVNGVADGLWSRIAEIEAWGT